MRTYIRIIIVLLSATCLHCFMSCGDKDKKELNKLILKLAESDNTIDSNDWDQIMAHLNAHDRQYGDLRKNGSVDEQELKSYIEDFFKNRRPPTDILFVGIGKEKHMSARFYLERSGSMVPYDATNGDGRFKSAIVGMLNNLPNDDNNKLYVVNSTINEYPQGIEQFVADKNIFEATRGLGDASYTDFGAIFKDILENTRKNSISILVTDMIYSTKNMNGVNPQKVFAEAQGMINSVFKQDADKKSMLVVKMMASYNGNYYCYNATSGKPYDGERPYYIVVVGDKQAMARLTTDSQYAAFGRLKDLKGYENEYLFETSEMYSPHYSIMMNYPEIKARFRPKKGQTTSITEIEDVEPIEGTSTIRLAVAVDLSRMLIDETYLTDVSNYAVEADDNIKIMSIKPIDRSNITPAEKKYVGNATHIITLETERVTREQDVNIRLKNVLPQWIENSSCDDDTDMHNETFSKTTFGLKYLMGGIYESYNRRAGNDGLYYFTLNIKIGNK